GVIYEVFKTLLRPYSALKRVAMVTFQLALVFLVALSCVVAYTQPTAEKHHLVAGVLVAEETTRVVEVGLLVFLFAFSTILGLHWRKYAFGIALGLGLFVSVELIGVTTRTRMGGAVGEIFGLARILAFTASLLIWIGYTLAPERVTSPVEVPKRAQLEQWNQAIMELINQ